jgi:hypothetical protein
MNMTKSPNKMNRKPDTSDPFAVPEKFRVVPAHFSRIRSGFTRRQSTVYESCRIPDC